MSGEPAKTPLPSFDWRLKTRRRIHFALILTGLSVLLLVLFLPRDPAPGRGCLAVIPPHTQMGHPDQDYFANVLTDTLGMAVSRTTDLRVLPNEVLSGDQTISQDNIARTLGATMLLTGQVSQEEDMLNLTLSLHKQPGGEHIWSRGYHHPSHDVAYLEAMVLKDLVSFFNPEGERLAQHAMVPDQYYLNATQYHAYLKGRSFLREGRSGEVHKALPFLNQVVEQRPEYIPIHGALAHLYLRYGDLLTVPSLPTDYLGLSLITEQTAYYRELGAYHASVGRSWTPASLQDDDAELLLAWGIVLFRDQWEWEAAEEAFLGALAFYDTYPEAHRWYMLYLVSNGRGEEAIRWYEHVADLLPSTLENQMFYARLLFLAGNLDEAKAQVRKICLRNPTNGQALFLNFLMDASRIESRKFFPRFRDWVKSLENVPNLYGSLREVRSLEFISPSKRPRLLRRYRLKETLSPVTLATLNVMAGKKDDAFIWLNRALNDHDDHLIFLEANPFFWSLHDDDRFTELLRQIRPNR